MWIKLLKTIVALLTIALLVIVIYGVGYWCCEGAATCARCEIHRPEVYAGVILCGVIAWSIFLSAYVVLTIERNFEGGKHLAAKGAAKSIGPDYGDDDTHSNPPS